MSKNIEIAISFICAVLLVAFFSIYNICTNPYNGYHKVVRMAELLNTPKRTVIEGESITYEIKYDPNKFGDEFTDLFIGMRNFSAEIVVENKEDSIATVTFNDIKLTERLLENEDENILAKCGITIGDKKEYIFFPFEIVNIYADISKVSEKDVRVGNNICFDITYKSKDLANTYLSEGSIALEGFEATKTVLAKDNEDHKYRLILEDVQLINKTIEKNKKCVIAITGGTGMRLNGALSPIAESAPFTLYNDAEYYLNLLIANGWLIFVTLGITSISSLLSIITFIANWKKKRSKSF